MSTQLSDAAKTAIEQARNLERKDDLAGAARLLEELTDREPGIVPALEALIRLTHAAGDHARTTQALGRLLAVEPGRTAARNDLTKLLLDLGRAPEAESHARLLTEQRPRDPSPWNLLGVALKRQNRNPEGLAAFIQAYKLDRKAFSALFNMATTYLSLRQADKALEAIKAAARLRPKDSEIARVTGNTYEMMGKTNEALAAYQHAIMLNPRNPLAFDHRAALRYKLGLLPEALADIERAIALSPQAAFLRSSKAKILRRLGRVAEAIALFEELLAQDPNNVDLLMALGNAYANHDGNIEKGNHYLRRAVELEPHNGYAAGRLIGSLLNSRHGGEANHLEEASRLARGVVARGRVDVETFDTLQSIFLRTADYDSLERLEEMADHDSLLTYWARPGIGGALHNQLGRVRSMEDRLALVEAHRQWGNNVERAIRPVSLPPRGPRDKIRIGIVSSDLRDHPVCYFAHPLLTMYDHSRFEIFCYSFYPGEPDRVQQALSQQVDSYKVIRNASIQDASRIIAEDRLDILFELGGTTHHNRIEVMAAKPCPVQVSWLGYPHSVGLSRIDYILVDPYLNPSRPDLLIEKPFMMPESWVVLSPVGFRPVPIEPGLPQDRQGVLTFGTLNNPYKFTPELIANWAAILNRVDNSRFMFVRPEAAVPAFRDNFLKEFAKYGIDPERIELVGKRGNHLPFYNQIDIALDSVPHTGGTTTCETLWMGVPAVTRIGDAFFERLSYSNLSNAGLGDLCARSDEEYVDIAVALAADKPRRDELRRTLRERIHTHPLGQIERFVRNWEATIRGVLGA
ncbi:MAG: tetratricopeptide repeat protein [Rhodospirillales bacterium]|nr:tetratricopeptide repeat protein [Rhodospirillales bacterium]